MRRSPVALALAGVLALAGCSAGAEPRQSVAPAGAERVDTTDGSFAGFTLTNPVAVPDATLTDTSGAAYPLRERTEGRVTLLYVGYTRCPDLCPLVLADLTVALRLLTEAERAQVEVLFVTADPVYDTPARMRAFLDRFDPSFVGLTGGREQLDPFYTALGIPLPVTAADGAELDADEVEHAADVYGFSPAGLGYLAYDSGATAQGYADDVRSLLAGRTPVPVPDDELVASGGVGRVGLVSVYRAFVRRTPDGAGELVLTMSNQGQTDELTRARLVDPTGAGVAGGAGVPLPPGGTPTPVGSGVLSFSPGAVPDQPAVDVELRFDRAGLLLLRVPVVGV